MNEFQRIVNEPNLLRVMIKMYRWEQSQRQEFRTLSGRDLYFRIASIYLDYPELAKNFKQMFDPQTERVARLRMREFEGVGFIETSSNAMDLRAKQVIPTEKFLIYLNEHLKHFKKICNQHYLMIEKNN